MALHLGVTTNVLSTSAQKLYGFCSLLRKGSFKVQYPLNCLISSRSKNYGPDDLSADRQKTTTCQSLKKKKKKKRFRNLYFQCLRLVILSPELAFLGWSPNTNLSSGRQRFLLLPQIMNISQTIYCFHVMRWNFLAWKPPLNTKCPVSQHEIPHQRDGCCLDSMGRSGHRLP